MQDPSEIVVEGWKDVILTNTVDFKIPCLEMDVYHGYVLGIGQAFIVIVVS